MRSIGIQIAIWSVLLFTAAAQAENRAGVVILNATGELITRCVTFEEDVLTVGQLLNRSGFSWIGDAEAEINPICYLHDDGAMDCSPHPDGYVWSVFLRAEDGWAPVSDSVSSVMVEHGSLTGFAFGPANEARPPELDFSAVCEIVSRAGLVVDFSNGSRYVESIEFYGETLTGLQLLRMSQLELVTRDFSFGVGICSIGGEGQPADDCFGDPDFRFWGVSVLNSNDEWASSSVGANDIVVYDGDVLGWMYAQWGEAQPPIRRADVFGSTSHVSFWRLYAR